MTTILLIRHGHTDWIGRALAGHTPHVSLDELGLQQAEQLPNRLEAVDIAAIYSSPLQRTLETAAPLARRRGLTVQQSPSLIEVDFGEWTGKAMTDLQSDPLWHRFNNLRSVTQAPGGDWMLGVQARVVAELETIRARHHEQTVAAISHQDTIKAALAHYLGIPLDLFHRFEIGPASVSVLRLADWGPQVVTVNNNGNL